MAPRPDWLRIVESSGLGYAVERAPDGRVGRAYWHEEHAYELSEDEVDHLERVTEQSHRMCVEAAAHLLGSPRLWASLSLPDAARELLADSLTGEVDRTLYGRFDLVWDGHGPVKILEYNADTPAGLVEAAVTQWEWLEHTLPHLDQWNLLHERLVKTWRELAAPGNASPDGTGSAAGGGLVHLAVGQDEPTEDWCTVAYLADTAAEAGLTPVTTTMEAIGWHAGRREFVDEQDRAIRTCFRMYPWEWMLTEPFGELLTSGAGDRVRWLEPAWKCLLGSKTILVALNEIYPGHENVLPATLGEPGPWRDGYVGKPVFGWEGAGIEVVTPDFRHRQQAGHTAGQHTVYQAYHPVPSFDGAHPVLGTWVVHGRAAGLGIRESDGPVTDTGARFLPHYLTAPRSTPEQITTWLLE